MVNKKRFVLTLVYQDGNEAKHDIYADSNNTNFEGATDSDIIIMP